MSQDPPFAFRYAERRPASALTPWIRNYWLLEVGPEAPEWHHVPPDGCTALVCKLGADCPVAVLSGPWLEPLTVPIRTGDRYAGVRLQPGAVSQVLGIDANSLLNKAEPQLRPQNQFLACAPLAMNDLSSIVELAEALDGLLTRLSSDWQPPDQLVLTAVQRLTDAEGEIAIADLATELGVSPRTLRRRFGAATALAPKQFARIRRLLGAAWRVAQGTESWSRAAAESGFADQPHLNREMLDLTGLTPKAFQARIRITSHDDVIP